jgi:hypothetical protein
MVIFIFLVLGIVKQIKIFEYKHFNNIMNTEFLYLIAEQLYLNASGHAMSNRNWIAAIYKSLLVANRGDDEEILWTKYSEWKIDHNCRAARSVAKKNKSRLISCDLVKTDSNEYKLLVQIEKGIDIISKTVLYRQDAFPEGLWKVKNPKNDTVLSNQFERDQLFLASLGDNVNSPIQDELISVKENTVKPVSNSSKPEKLDISLYSDLDEDYDTEFGDFGAEEQVDTISSVEYARNMKFEALKLLLDQVRDKYHQTEEPLQRSFLLTVIGAAIFYLPSLNAHFSGYISVAALKGFIRGQRRVKDHIFPRKRAASELLSRDFSLKDLKSKYHDHLAEFMYVTYSENSQLINFYEEHDDHNSALEAFQIEKFPMAGVERFSSHRELDQFILFLRGKQVENKTTEDLNNLLGEFRAA